MIKSKLAVTLETLGKWILPTFFIFLLVGAVYPCKCVKADFKTNYKNVDMVVLAKIIETVDNGDNTVEMKIEIIKAWKTDASKTMTIVIEKDTCEYQMATGEIHLLYLEKLASGNFTTNRCRGNLPEDKSSKAKSWLEKYARKTRIWVC